MNIESIPEGLHSLQYAAKICEETLGLPAIKANLELVAACIEAVAKKLFRGRPDELKVSTYWLTRRIETAQSQGEKITTHWLRNGEYWNVDRPSKMPGKPTYEHFGQGYGEADMKYLYSRYSALRKSVNRPLTDAEIETLMADLDKKRGGAPEWRRHASS